MKTRLRAEAMAEVIMAAITEVTTGTITEVTTESIMAITMVAASKEDMAATTGAAMDGIDMVGLEAISFSQLWL